jgi:hypothetical protein
LNVKRPLEPEPLLVPLELGADDSLSPNVNRPEGLGAERFRTLRVEVEGAFAGSPRRRAIF